MGDTMAYISEQQQQHLNRQIATLPQAALDELAAFLTHLDQKFVQANSIGTLDEESRTWLEADLAGDLPEYDWGEAGIPPVQPVRFVPGQGLIVDGVN
jgi:hypothetical protein